MLLQLSGRWGLLHGDGLTQWSQCIGEAYRRKARRIEADISESESVLRNIETVDRMERGELDDVLAADMAAESTEPASGDAGEEDF